MAGSGLVNAVRYQTSDHSHSMVNDIKILFIFNKLRCDNSSYAMINTMFS